MPSSRPSTPRRRKRSPAWLTCSRGKTCRTSAFRTRAKPTRKRAPTTASSSIATCASWATWWRSSLPKMKRPPTRPSRASRLPTTCSNPFWTSAPLKTTRCSCTPKTIGACCAIWAATTRATSWAPRPTKAATSRPCWPIAMWFWNAPTTPRPTTRQ